MALARPAANIRRSVNSNKAVGAMQDTRMNDRRPTSQVSKRQIVKATRKLHQENVEKAFILCKDNADGARALSHLTVFPPLAYATLHRHACGLSCIH